MKQLLKTMCLLMFIGISSTINAQNYTTYTITNNSTTCSPVSVTIYTSTGSYNFSVFNGFPVTASCQLMGIPTNIQFTDASGNEFTVPPHCTCNSIACVNGGSQGGGTPTCNMGGCVGSGAAVSKMTFVQNPPGGCGFVGALYTLNINFY